MADTRERSASDVTGVVVLHDHDVATVFGRRDRTGNGLGAPRRHRDSGRILCAWLQENGNRIEFQRLDEFVDEHAFVVERHPDHFGADLLEQIEQRRERGMLDHHAIAEMHHHLCHAIERVHRPVDHRDLVGCERPARAQRRLELGQHRVIEIRTRERLAAHSRQRRPQIGKQARIGRAGRQIECEVSAIVGIGHHASVATRRTRSGGLAHERTVTTESFDRADVGQRTPRLADRRGTDSQSLRQVAHRGQSRPHHQFSRRHQPRNGRGDTARAAIGDVSGDEVEHFACVSRT